MLNQNKILTPRQKLYESRKYVAKTFHDYGGILVPKKYQDLYKTTGAFINPVLDTHEVLTRD